MSAAAEPARITPTFALGLLAFLVIAALAWSALHLAPEAGDVRSVGLAFFRVLRPRRGRA